MQKRHLTSWSVREQMGTGRALRQRLRDLSWDVLSGQKGMD